MTAATDEDDVQIEEVLKQAIKGICDLFENEKVPGDIGRTACLNIAAVQGQRAGVALEEMTQSLTDVYRASQAVGKTKQSYN